MKTACPMTVSTSLFKGGKDRQKKLQAGRIKIQDLLKKMQGEKHKH